jgi:hypothetical protein
MPRESTVMSLLEKKMCTRHEKTSFQVKPEGRDKAGEGGNQGDVVLPSLPFPSLPSPPVLSSSFLTFIFSLFIYCLSLSPSALGHDKVTGAELFFS